MTENSLPSNPPKRENMLINLSFNLLFPILFLRKGEDWFGETLADWLDSP